jgi:hypothetical protein
MGAFMVRSSKWIIQGKDRIIIVLIFSRHAKGVAWRKSALRHGRDQ